ncbi:MAG: hypothetical protein GWN16_12275, partial [Calditrichae bacterium]|nr:hypothetical protein [Calditrichia bacterium]
AFARADYPLREYNVLLWERDFGNYSHIFLKTFADPDSEIAVNPLAAGGFSQEPVAAHFPTNGALLIVWQSDQPGNFDLYSILYVNGEFRHYQQITTHPSDDLHPDLVGNSLVWQRDSTILHSHYTLTDSAWSAPEVLDSGSCANPTISRGAVAYQKRVGDDFSIYRRTQTSGGVWNPPQLVSPDGDSRLPSFSKGLPLSLIWQHRDTTDWNIMNLSEAAMQPQLFIFSSADEIRPRAVEPSIISESDFF